MRIVYSMAFSLGTGRLPGWPRHTGQVWVLGAAPNSLRHPQNIFVAVESSTWHSSPITVSNSVADGDICSERYRPATALNSPMSLPACTVGARSAMAVKVADLPEHERPRERLMKR